MTRVGVSGTYREAVTRVGVMRIVCDACGFTRKVPPEEARNYELWYATGFRRQRLWAVNREHLEFLIAWFSNEIGSDDLSVGNRAMVEAFPKWMVLAKNREEILKRLQTLRDIGPPA